jgi:Lon protease-like protein
MTNFIPIFPLDLVIYPDETLNLHIFEPRYKQLIKECAMANKSFGIPVLQKEKALEYGTSVAVTEIAKEYEDGSMDIRVKGIQVFRILEVVRELPEKLYSGAIVNYPENDKIKVHYKTSGLVYNEVKRLYHLLKLDHQLPGHKKNLMSYDIAHRVGLTKDQEYELLSIFNEVQRMEFLRRHLNSVMSALDNLEILKARINLN